MESIPKQGEKKYNNIKELWYRVQCKYDLKGLNILTTIKMHLDKF